MALGVADSWVVDPSQDHGLEDFSSRCTLFSAFLSSSCDSGERLSGESAGQFSDCSLTVLTLSPSPLALVDHCCNC